MAAQPTLKDLDTRPASDLKKAGWRDVMRSVRRSGRVLVTNHNEPEAVILSVEQYTALMQTLAEREHGEKPALVSLRERFDEQLAVLQQASAADRLRALIDEPAVLEGEVRAGDTH